MRLGTAFLFAFVLSAFLSVPAQTRPKPGTVPAKNGDEVSILVTAVPHGEKQRAVADKLRPEDFAVYENKRRQTIVSSRAAAEAPMSIAIVIQDDLSWRVNSEIKTLRKFIEDLPEGTRVLTAYLTTGGAIVTQEFTTDKKQAAETLRIIRGGSLPPSFSPFDGVSTVAKQFAGIDGRRLMLVVSNGLDASRGFAGANPFFSVSLDQAIGDCQRTGVAVYSIYAPRDQFRIGRRFELNYGQSSLIRLSDETGGESYSNGIDFINFSPYLEEFNESSLRQWLIVYKSSTVGKGFRKIEVRTDFDIDLHHPAGYTPKKVR